MKPTKNLTLVLALSLSLNLVLTLTLLMTLALSRVLTLLHQQWDFYRDRSVQPGPSLSSQSASACRSCSKNKQWRCFRPTAAAADHLSSLHFHSSRVNTPSAAGQRGVLWKQIAIGSSSHLPDPSPSRLKIHLKPRFRTGAGGKVLEWV